MFSYVDFQLVINIGKELDIFIGEFTRWVVESGDTIITEYVEKLFLVNIEDDSTAFLMVVCVCILLSDYSYNEAVS